MNIWINILLGLSFSGTLLILILFLCKPFYKNRLSQTWQYYIYFIVIIRLLLPFTTNLTITEHLLSKLDIPLKEVSNHSFYLENNNPKEAMENKTIENEILDKKEIHTISTINTNDKKETSKQHFIFTIRNHILPYFYRYFFILWIIVAITLFIRKITQYQGFLNYIKAGKKEITSFELLELLGSEIEHQNIKAIVTLYENNLISSPLLIGFFHPCIILPSMEFSNIDFQNIIRHELIHFKRKDMFYKWLVQFITCLYWFNPFIYLMGAEINRLCELSCDEMLIKTLDEKGKKEYGNTLLNAVGKGSTLKSSLASVTLNEGNKLLKERMDSIMKFKKKTKLHSALSLVFSLMLCITATIFGDVFIQKEDTRAAAEKIEQKQMKNTKTDSLFDESDLDLIDQYIKDNKVILIDNCYYILCNGATKKDMPSGSCDGINITIVTKSGYASMDPDSLDSIVEDIKECCANWYISKDITKKSAKLAIGLAVRLKQNNGTIHGLTDSTKEEYEQWDITKDKKGNFYYNKKRISLLLDFKADHSFEQFHYDKKGTVNIKIVRNKKGQIKKLATLTSKEIKKYLPTEVKKRLK